MSTYRPASSDQIAHCWPHSIRMFSSIWRSRARNRWSWPCHRRFTYSTRAPSKSSGSKGDVLRGGTPRNTLGMPASSRGAEAGASVAGRKKMRESCRSEAISLRGRRHVRRGRQAEDVDVLDRRRIRAGRELHFQPRLAHEVRDLDDRLRVGRDGDAQNALGLAVDGRLAGCVEDRDVELARMGRLRPDPHGDGSRDRNYFACALLGLDDGTGLERLTQADRPKLRLRRQTRHGRNTRWWQSFSSTFARVRPAGDGILVLRCLVFGY